MKPAYLSAACIIIMLITTPVKAQQYNLESRFMPEPVTVEIVIPEHYNPQNNYPLLYLLHGYSSDYSQWSEISNLQKISDDYGFIIVSPDGFRSFFMNSPVNELSQYESFFFEDLTPFIHDRVSVDSSGVFISGLSMGGFGALNLLLSRPGYFAGAGSTSGAVEFNYLFWKQISLQYLGNSMLADDLELILGSSAEHEENWAKHSLTNRAKDFKEISAPFFIDVGTEDPLFNAHLKLIANLREHQVPVQFFTKPGGHESVYWKDSIHYHLNFFQKIVDRKN